MIQLIDVDDDAAVDLPEAIRIDLGEQGFQRQAHQSFALAGNDLHIAAGRFQADHLINRDQPDACADLHFQTAQIIAALLMQQTQRGDDVHRRCLQALLHAGNAILQALAGIGFQQVINGAGFKCRDGVFVVSGDENIVAGVLRACRDIQTVDFAHLDIKKCHLRLQLIDGFQCFLAAAGARNDARLWPELRQFSGQAFQQNGFIISDDNIDHRLRHGPAAPVSPACNCLPASA